MAEDSPGRRTAAKLEIQMDDDVAQGMYINLCMVHHDENEFTIDVMYAPPHRRRARIRARIISSPKHTKRLMHALQDQIGRYEERYGTIDVTGPNPADRLLH